MLSHNSGVPNRIRCNAHQLGMSVTDLAAQTYPTRPRSTLARLAGSTTPPALWRPPGSRNLDPPHQASQVAASSDRPPPAGSAEERLNVTGGDPLLRARARAPPFAQRSLRRKHRPASSWANSRPCLAKHWPTARQGQHRPKFGPILSRSCPTSGGSSPKVCQAQSKFWQHRPNSADSRPKFAQSGHRLHGRIKPSVSPESAQSWPHLARLRPEPAQSRPLLWSRARQILAQLRKASACNHGIRRVFVPER